MPILSNADLTKVLQAVTILNSGVDFASLPARTLSSVNLLIPNELAAFDGFDPEGFYDGSLWYSPPGTVPLDRVEILGELVHQHPYFHRLIATPDLDVTRTSDAMPLEAFHKTALFNEFYRIFDGDVQMSCAMRLAPNTLVTCSIHRPKLDFSDREFQMWSAIAPHLKAAFKNTQFVTEIDSERRYLDRATSRGIVVVDSNGVIKFSSRLAEEWLRKYFGEVWGGDLPKQIREYLATNCPASEAEGYRGPAEPMSVSIGTEELKVSVTFDTSEREVLILLEERRQHTVSDFEHAGVTHREAEILFWIGRGKTDPDIAELLGISTRTVQKHVEHIFTKLGVETRTAAVMSALDALG